LGITSLAALNAASSRTARYSDPELMIRMLIVGYCFGIRSERRLCEEVHLNLAYRWFCRLWLDGAVPITRPSQRTATAGFDRRSAYGTVERLQLTPQLVELDKPVDRSQQVPLRHMLFDRELVEQRVLLDFPLPHHRLPPSRRDPQKSRNYNQ
jgi:hypothetical protein